MKDYNNNDNNKICCAYCGKDFSQHEDWPYVEGDSNRGVLKIEHFCSEEHKHNFFTSRSDLLTLHLSMRQDIFKKICSFGLSESVPTILCISIANMATTTIRKTNLFKGCCCIYCLIGLLP
jgi:hypothetical protein